MTPKEEFLDCLGTISFARAGWDVYSMPLAQKEAEASASKKAMARAREIWRENPDQRDALRQAFKEYSPLATIGEIERG